LRVIADTNVLVRVAVNDDPEQAGRARELLREADTIALTVAALL
jgi:predicted nucleic acid-binding protein